MKQITLYQLFLFILGDVFVVAALYLFALGIFSL